MNRHQNIIQLSITLTIVGTYSGYTSQLEYSDNYKFTAILGDCYQLYQYQDLNSTCRRYPNRENQSCIQWLSPDRKCLGLITPAGERVTLRCTSDTQAKKCFEVYDKDNNVSMVCQQSIGGQGIGITTPDKFTILFHHHFCRTITKFLERMAIYKFAKSFSINSQSCYKVYKPEEVVTPYNCLSEDIFDACVFRLSNGCSALTTQHNEVLILDCPDKSQMPAQNKCFYLHSSDNQVHTVCQKKVEERCIGIVTPSNLTVLLGCFFCADFHENYIGSHKDKHAWRVLHEIFSNIVKGEHLFVTGEHYGGFKEESAEYRAFLVEKLDGQLDCLGIFADTYTIVLHCAGIRMKRVGCFDVIKGKLDTGKRITTVCVKLVDEGCIGITTPDNWTLVFYCTESSVLDANQPEETERESEYYPTTDLVHNNIPTVQPERFRRGL